MDLRKYQQAENDYEHLSMRDLLDARDLYHVYLMRHPNVVATAIGRYRIRITDGWPTETGAGKKGTGERTLDNSEVRPYSWPSVLAFVDHWEDKDAFGKGGIYDPDQMVPKTLFLPDGRRVPVCVIRAPRELATEQEVPPDMAFPTNNIGGGYPILATVQGRERVATIGCLVTDGHKVYALTNRHVTGAAGEVLKSRLNGKEKVIGMTAPGQCDRLSFNTVYEGWPGAKVYVNIDAGLIEIDNLDVWSAKIRDVGIVGPLADLSVDNLTLSLTGCAVRGYGASSGMMLGELQALFYRYKALGGFEYVADFLIGPRATPKTGAPARADAPTPFVTRPGDSGTLWLLEPMKGRDESTPKHGGKKSGDAAEPLPYLPLAIQWGAHVLDASGGGRAQTFVLATCLSTVCRQLGVDLVRDWNLDQPDTWGAVGHFSIASRTIEALTDTKLQRLMKRNLSIITHKDKTIINSEFKNMGSDPFVPMADVPDFFWKHGRQGHKRGSEGPNHFADMDQYSAPKKGSLLKLCEDPVNIDPDVWNEYYDTVSDILTGEPIGQEHRGLLPFRVWQIFEAMVGFARDGEGAKFVCAAGVLAHYTGDACQPLHISYLHDGDPKQAKERTVHHHDGTTSNVREPLGKGVHAAYEDEMVNANREVILEKLSKTKEVKPTELITTGRSAAERTVALMRLAFEEIPPAKIVSFYVKNPGKAGRAEAFWRAFGTGTIKCMQAGTHLTALLWQSAWEAGGGGNTIDPMLEVSEENAMDICADVEFLASCTIEEIGAVLNAEESDK